MATLSMFDVLPKAEISPYPQLGAPIGGAIGGLLGGLGTIGYDRPSSAGRDAILPIVVSKGNRRTRTTAAAGAALIVAASLGIIAIGIGDGTFEQPAQARTVVDGLTIFAIFFTAAFAIERMLEPISRLLANKEDLVDASAVAKSEAGLAVKKYLEAVAQDWAAQESLASLDRQLTTPMPQAHLPYQHPLHQFPYQQDLGLGPSLMFGPASPTNPLAVGTMPDGGSLIALPADQLRTLATAAGPAFVAWAESAIAAHDHQADTTSADEQSGSGDDGTAPGEQDQPAEDTENPLIAVPLTTLTTLLIAQPAAAPSFQAFMPVDPDTLRQSAEDTAQKSAETAAQIRAIAEDHLRKATDAVAAIEDREYVRSTIFWSVATVVAMAASASLHLYFLRSVGITSGARWMEILATGLIIGAGTKPLHDLTVALSARSK